MQISWTIFVFIFIFFFLRWVRFSRGWKNCWRNQFLYHMNDDPYFLNKLARLKKCWTNSPLYDELLSNRRRWDISCILLPNAAIYYYPWPINSINSRDWSNNKFVKKWEDNPFDISKINLLIWLLRMVDHPWLWLLVNVLNIDWNVGSFLELITITKCTGS